MFTLGMDIGCSVLPLVWDDNDSKSLNMAVHPAGAAPNDCISASMASKRSRHRLKVVVEGVEYVAGIEQLTSTIVEGSQAVTAHDPVTTNAREVLNYGRR